MESVTVASAHRSVQHSLAVKNLLSERTRFAISVIGVGFAVLLVLITA